MLELEDLADRIADGDEDAFEDVHRRMAAGIRRFFERRVSSKTAEALAQDCWLELWRALEKGRFDRSRARLTTFAYAIASQVLARHLRDTHRRRGDSGPVPDEAEPWAGTEPAEIAHFESLLIALKDCLHTSVDRGDRRMLGHIYEDDRSEHDVARTMGLPQSTVHDRKKSALGRLFRCLREKNFEDAGHRRQRRGFTPRRE